MPTKQQKLKRRREYWQETKDLTAEPRLKYRREYYVRTKDARAEKRRANDRTQYRRHRKKRLEKNRLYRIANAERLLAYRKDYSIRKFGITSEKYFQMSSDQGGVCKICSGVEKCGRRLAIDHCHRTNIVRGLLCGPCNNLLGLCRESIPVLLKAIDYLKQFQQNQPKENYDRPSDGV